MGFMTNCLRQRSLSRASRSRVFGAVALLAAAVMVVAPAHAQDTLSPNGGSRASLTDGTRPVVSVTLASVNKLMQDINYVTGVVGQPQFGGMFAMMAGVYAQGMDLDRPVGVLVPLVNGTPQPIVVLPTSDIKPILKRLEPQTGPVDELPDGTLVVTVGPNTVYVKQSGNNAIAAQSKDVLQLVPESPAALFEGMGNEFNIAVRLQVQQVPVEIRNVLIDQMRSGFESAMRQQQSNAQSAREMAENSIEQLEKLIQQADELNVGINIDQADRNIGVHFSFSAVSGTELAAMYGGQQPIPSRFASVIRDDAAAYFHSASSVSPEAVDQARESMDSSFQMVTNALSQDGNLSEDQINEIEGYINRLKEIIVESFAEGKADMGGVVLAGEDQFQVALGTFVADGTKVADLAKDLAKKVPDSPDAPTFKFDAGNFGGVTLHVIEADIPANEDEARKLFGEKIQIHIGTAPKAVYVALGRGSEQVLKNLISSGTSDNGGERPLGQFNMRLLPFMQLAQSVEMNEDLAAVIGALSGSDDKGQIRVVSESIPNGASVNITFGEGLLKAVGAAAAANQRQQAPAF